MNEVIVVNKRPAAVYLENRFKLVPGRNRIDEKAFNKMKDLKGFKIFLEAKYIQILEPKAVIKNEPLPVDIALDAPMDAKAVANDVAPSKRSKAKPKKPVEPVAGEIAILKAD